MAADGSGAVGNGAASTNSSSDWYHWGQGNVDAMGTNPTWTCARASSTGAYTHFWGSSSMYADLKNTTLFFSNISTNTQGW
jgi:hypothetical protein